MTEMDFFGHVFYAFLAIGTWFLGKRDINGWRLRMFGNVGWIVLGVMMGMSSIWIWEIIFLILAYKAYLEWKEQAKIEEYQTELQEELEDCQRLGAEALQTIALDSKFLRITKFGLEYDMDTNYYGSLARLKRNEERGKN